MSQVYIDMDGVVADFDKHILDVYGKPMSDMSSEEKKLFWTVDCVSFEFFEHAPEISEGTEMVRVLVSEKIPISFLTSTGGGIHHNKIARQKLSFLYKHGMGRFPVAFCTGTKSKARFASPTSILIDDRDKVVQAFREAGGTAFLFERSNWLEIYKEVRRGVNWLI